jgi:hypothetical protein
MPPPGLSPCVHLSVPRSPRSEQTLGLEELRKMVLRTNPDLKDKAAFWKRKASVLKVGCGGGSQPFCKAAARDLFTCVTLCDACPPLWQGNRAPWHLCDPPCVTPHAFPHPPAQAHMLLLAFLERESDSIPLTLQVGWGAGGGGWVGWLGGAPEGAVCRVGSGRALQEGRGRRVRQHSPYALV